MTKINKAEKILDVALELLKTEGDHGVTMRKIAASANMSLSNVQYYFKTKDILLKSLADRYFQACLEDIRAMPALESVEADLENLLSDFLCHGLELTEMCRIFREYWAISTRNESIDEYVQQYYKDQVDILATKLRPVAASEKGLSEALSLFIPFVEGYSLTARAMPEDIHSVTRRLAVVISDLLRNTK